MSRNPEYQFLDTDPRSIETELAEKYREFTGMEARQASPERLHIKWLADIVLQERARENKAINQNLPSRAEGEYLDALAELYPIQRRAGAAAAVCMVRFAISEAQEEAVLVPKGTRVTDEGKNLYWATKEAGYIPAGETYIDLQAVCMTEGTRGNGWRAGEINTVVDIYDYCAGCGNLTETDGGADTMTDDEFYEAMRLSTDAPSTAGAIGGYVYHAKKVSAEIADVAVSSPSPGEVRIYALMRDGNAAGETMKALILAACGADDVRPLTDHVLMGDPETVEYSIDLTYYIRSGSSNAAGDLKTAVEKAVEEYVAWQGGKLGRDINPSVLMDCILTAGKDGEADCGVSRNRIKRVEVRKPVYTRLRDGKTPLQGSEDTPRLAVPQVARVVSVNLINGGIEDE